MRDLKTIRKRAAKIAESLNSPLGPVPIERVVRTHISFFQDLRAVGASWTQISNLLREAGLRTRRNDPVNENVLRATFARASRGVGDGQPDNKSQARRHHKAVADEERSSAIIAADGQPRVIAGDIAARMNRAASIRHGRGGA